jgi:hypothetical protein
MSAAEDAKYLVQCRGLAEAILFAKHRADPRVPTERGAGYWQSVCVKLIEMIPDGSGGAVSNG